MNYCTPFLPDSKVKDMLVSSLLPINIINELNILGIRPLKAGKTDGISTQIAYHPDILAFNYAPGKWLAERNSQYLHFYMNNILTRVDAVIGASYPNDCLFNSFVCGDIIFCGRSASELYAKTDAISGYKHVVLNQGYAKCAVILVNNHSFITSDKSIEKKLKELQYDCLYVTNNGIGLNGYSCGFIGGCSGKADKNTLLFTGDIKKHVDYQKIKSFCGNHGVSVYSLGKDMLYDYGGLLPVTME